MSTFGNEVPRRRGLAVALLATMVLVVAGVSATEAALTKRSCPRKKLKVWGQLRTCHAKQSAKALKGKPADPGKCQTKFDARLAKLNKNAAAKDIECRYKVNGDGTVTDYDTGLQWEQKTDDRSVHGKDIHYSWSDGGGGFTQPDGTAFTVFLGTLNHGASGDGKDTSGCFAGHCDWRLPTIEELRGILDCTQVGRGPCIDQAAFGPMPTSDLRYWSASTDAGTPSIAWGVLFSDDGTPFTRSKNSGSPNGGHHHVRAVRSGFLAPPLLVVAEASPAKAALTTPSCLAKKRRAWGQLRTCQAKRANPEKCQTQFKAKLAKLTKKATAAGVACRYGLNGDGTATDYDTGMQWEQKTDDGSVHDKDNTYTWCVGEPRQGFFGTPSGICKNRENPPSGTAFKEFLWTLNDGVTTDGKDTSGCFAGHCDWRLPTIEELKGIKRPCCGDEAVKVGDICDGQGCIDQTVFGPVGNEYWSTTVYHLPHEPQHETDQVWFVSLDTGYVGILGKWEKDYYNALAVRSGL